jgi:hypothetical protein
MKKKQKYDEITYKYLTSYVIPADSKTRRKI